jgi:cytochrome c peroxidase
MKRNNILFGFVFTLIAIISVAFSYTENEPLFIKPSNFPEPIYDFAENPLTTEGVALGKALFYDALLSKDNTISCGSCHQQTAGFTQHGHALSHGINDALTKRNSMPLANMAWVNAFGWDGGVHDLDLFPVSPLTNPAEMDENLPNILEKLRKTSTYPALFQKAFGTEEINTERFLKALSQFMLTMVSANSKYDKAMRNEGEILIEVETQGETIFKQKCASCHSGVLFTDLKYRNNGLKPAKSSDLGRYDVTLNEKDRLAFKVPSLRNLASTAPYMHDGRFGTLEDVLEYYNTDVENSATLDPILKQNGRLGIPLSPDDKTKLLAFLKTLNDDDFLKDEKYAEFSKAKDPEAEKYKDTDWGKMDLQTNSATIKTTFKEALTLYFTAKNALALENGATTSAAIDKLFDVFNGMDKTALSPMQRAFFQKIYDDLSFEMEHVADTKDYSHQRDHFGDLSKHLFNLIKSFKVHEKTLYYFHCPNAFNKMGGYWIGETENDKNPFFKKNKDCGAVKMVLLPK